MFSRIFLFLSVLLAFAVGLASSRVLYPAPTAEFCQSDSSPEAVFSNAFVDPDELASAGIHVLTNESDLDVVDQDRAANVPSVEQQRRALRGLVEELDARNMLLDEHGEPVVLDHIDQAKLHFQLKEFLASNDAAVSEMLNLYSTLEDSTLRMQLRSLIAELNAKEVEQFAIDLTLSGDPQSVLEGVDLFAYMDSSNNTTREALFEVIQNTSDATLIAAAIRAMRPEILPLETSQQIQRQLGSYGSSNHAAIRAAVIEQMSAWSGSSATEKVVSKGLFDDSEEVRSAAIFCGGEWSGPFKFYSATSPRYCR